MTRIEALIELRDDVKSGKGWSQISGILAMYAMGIEHVVLIPIILDPKDIRAMGAAKALHEAVLPGWGWQVFALTDCDYVAVLDGPEFSTPEIEAPYTPARAWLLAILEALIAQEQSK